MLINIPLHRDQDYPEEAWINPAFIILVADMVDGAMITLSGDQERILLSPLSAQAVAQLCYEARHNL